MTKTTPAMDHVEMDDFEEANGCAASDRGEQREAKQGARIFAAMGPEPGLRG